MTVGSILFFGRHKVVHRRESAIKNTHRGVLSMHVGVGSFVGVRWTKFIWERVIVYLEMINDLSSWKENIILI